MSSIAARSSSTAHRNRRWPTRRSCAHCADDDRAWSRMGAETLKPRRALIAGAVIAVVTTAAMAGHEVPVYPSYYPHEVAIEGGLPERAAGLLRGGKMQA